MARRTVGGEPLKIRNAEEARESNNAEEAIERAEHRRVT